MPSCAGYHYPLPSCNLPSRNRLQMAGRTDGICLRRPSLLETGDPSSLQCRRREPPTFAADPESGCLPGSLPNLPIHIDLMPIGKTVVGHWFLWGVGEWFLLGRHLLGLLCVPCMVVPPQPQHPNFPKRRNCCFEPPHAPFSCLPAFLPFLFYLSYSPDRNTHLAGGWWNCPTLHLHFPLQSSSLIPIAISFNIICSVFPSPVPGSDRTCAPDLWLVKYSQ